VSDPPDSVLRWAAVALGEGASIVSAVGLHDGTSPWRLQVEGVEAASEAILRAPRGGMPWERGYVATGVVGLTVAEVHGLPAPRLIAYDLHGRDAGTPASLETVLPGTPGWPPTQGMPSPAGWRDAGAVIARVHRVRPRPWDNLAPRVRPVEYDDFARQRRWATVYQASTEEERPDVVAAFAKFQAWPEALTQWTLANARTSPLANERTSPLLFLADEVVRRHGLPRGESVFLHGDAWPGNVVWEGDTCVGLIDWKTAGVGHPGVDLGNLRFQAAQAHGTDAAELVLEGWEDEMGRRAADVAYWDAVAALNTLTDEAPASFDVQEGAASAIQRRDSFLRAALKGLGV
jgi:aminoglycoside phosphotransferase (APT) family kinase protein